MKRFKLTLAEQMMLLYTLQFLVMSTKVSVSVYETLKDAYSLLWLLVTETEGRRGGRKRGLAEERRTPKQKV